MSETLYVKGLGPVEITNWDDFVGKVLFLLGEELLNQIQDEAMKMGLYINGDYIRGMRYEIEGDSIIFTNDVSYALFLEYGTYEFGFAFSEETYPPVPFAKKKNLSKSAREAFPRGMQPFATYRRVLYDEKRVGRALKEVTA